VASYVQTATRIYAGPLDLSGLANEVDFGPITVAMKDSTTFNDGGYSCVLPSIISGKATVKGFSDFATGRLDDTISIGQLGAQYAFTTIPNPTGTVTAADTAWFSRGVIDTTHPFTGPIGEMAKFELGLPFDTVVLPGKVAAPLAAVTANTNGTAVAMAGPTASQHLYAVVHVTALSGFSAVVFKIQSDDNSGFTSATDRITFTTATGVTSQFASVAGSFSSETHHRITATVTGSGSVSYVSAFAVL
jgi:hypothetical protein